MKKHSSLKMLIAGFGLLALFGCQKVPVVPDNYVDPGSTDASDGVKLCTDGTLNCYVTVTNTILPIEQIHFNQNYTTCMNTCFDNKGVAICNDYSTIEIAEDSCPEAFTACDSQCSVVASGTGTSVHIPDSDPITLPENPVALFVDITGCYDEAAPYEIHFQGPTVSFETPIEGGRSLHSSGFLGLGTKSTKLGFGVSRVPDTDICGTDLQNAVKVLFTPIKESTVTYGTEKITVVPFSSGIANIEKLYPMPHSVPFGIPATYRDLVDLSQVTWLLKEIPAAEPDMGSNSMWAFRYYNPDTAYGTSLVMLDYAASFSLGHVHTTTKQTVKMILFIKSK